MNLIDTTYFGKYPLLITSSLDFGAGTSQSQDTERLQKLTDLITYHQPNYLRDLLGVKLRDALLSGLAEEPILAKWTDLKAQIVDTVNFLSPLANYVYFFYQNPSLKTDSGEVVTEVDNMQTGDVWAAQVPVWNDMVKSNYVILAWLDEHAEDYEDYQPEDTAELSEVYHLINRLGI